MKGVRAERGQKAAVRSSGDELIRPEEAESQHEARGYGWVHAQRESQEIETSGVSHGEGPGGWVENEVTVPLLTPHSMGPPLHHPERESTL